MPREGDYLSMKVLYMSGYTEDGIIHHGVMGKGMNYIQKPFTVNGLTRKVREVLNQSGSIKNVAGE